MATPGGFSLGISAEEKLALPLGDDLAYFLLCFQKYVTMPFVDALIQKAKTHKLMVKATDKKKTQIAPKKSKKQSHKKQNVKKTIIVPVSKAARAKVNTALASAKRQTVINKRRPGLVVSGKNGKKNVPIVSLRPYKTSAARKHLKKTNVAIQKGLDVSNILNHFRTHPKKFDVPKGSNLRVTINLNNVEPVLGRHK